MKAAVYQGNQRIRVEDVGDFPPPGPGDIVLKVRYCGVCGSDVHMFTGTNLQPGAIMGHEFTGTVVALGPETQGWQVGDRAAAIPSRPCNQCAACDARLWEYCTSRQGGRAYSEYARSHISSLFHVPDHMSWAAAAMLEPLAVSLHGVRRSSIRVGDTAFITGAGPIGLLALQCVRLSGASTVLVSEPSPRRAEMARELGADEVFNPFEVDVVAAAKERLPGGADIGYECSGVRGTAQTVSECVKDGAEVMQIGALRSDEIRVGQWVGREIRYNTASKTRPDFPIAMRLLAGGKIKVDPMVTIVSPLEGLEDTLNTLTKPLGDGLALIDPWGDRY